MNKLLVAALGVVSVTLVSAQGPPPGPAPDAAKQRALIDQYCVTCHNARLKTANLLLDQLDLAHLGDHAEIGEKVVRKLRAGMMPPTGVRRPDPATLRGADPLDGERARSRRGTLICRRPASIA